MALDLDLDLKSDDLRLPFFLTANWGGGGTPVDRKDIFLKRPRVLTEAEDEPPVPQKVRKARNIDEQRELPTAQRGEVRIGSGRMQADTLAEGSSYLWGGGSDP